MTHAEFVNAYRTGQITVKFTPARAGQFLSARLLLPVFMLPLLGAGVGLALLGWLWSGLALIATGIIAPRLIKRAAPHFLLTQMLADEKLYADVQHAGVMRVIAIDTTPA